MKPIAIGILSKEDIRARVLAIARGDLRPRPQDPKVWFTSMRSLAEVLSDENRALLRLIEQAKPRSVAVLAGLTGRRPGNLSRTLRTMANYGFVEMRRVKREVMPIAKATRFRIVA